MVGGKRVCKTAAKIVFAVVMGACLIGFVKGVCVGCLIGSIAKNLTILQNQWKTSQIGYLYAINRSIIIQKAIVIA